MSHSTHTIQQALRASPALADLQKRSTLGKQRLAALFQLLPPAITQTLNSGACDEEDWCILVPNAAVAAKLRQWVPAITSTLVQTEQRTVKVRIKIASGA